MRSAPGSIPWTQEVCGLWGRSGPARSLGTARLARRRGRTQQQEPLLGRVHRLRGPDRKAKRGRLGRRGHGLQPSTTRSRRQCSGRSAELARRRRQCLALRRLDPIRAQRSRRQRVARDSYSGSPRANRSAVVNVNYRGQRSRTAFRNPIALLGVQHVTRNLDRYFELARTIGEQNDCAPQFTRIACHPFQMDHV